MHFLRAEHAQWRIMHASGRIRTHNTNTNILGYDPMSLVTGKAVTFPGISTGNIATESMFDSEAVKKVMERHHEVMKEFREVEYST